MKKRLTGVLLALYFAFVCFTGTAEAAGLKGELELTNGYRVDNFDWNIAGDLSGRNPNVLSELVWSHLKIYQVKAATRVTAHEVFYLRGSLARGWFEWETEGYPFWGNMHHTKTWWEFRHLDNILFVHYNDLLADVESEITRVARFLDIEVQQEAVSSIARAVSFSTMKSIADRMDPGAWKIWEDGGSTFFFKGTNGRWKGVLSEHELKLYRNTLSGVVPADCAQWLEHGCIAQLQEEETF